MAEEFTLEERLTNIKNLLDGGKLKEADSEISDEIIENLKPEHLREIYKKIERLDRDEAELFVASCTSYNKYLKGMDVVDATSYILGEGN